MFTAPKLKNIRFAYHPLDFITPFAFADLPNLESLDIAGNGAKPTLDVLKKDTLIFEANNFTYLGRGSNKKKKSREFSLSLRPPPPPPSKVGNLFMIFFDIQGSNLGCFLAQFTTFGNREKGVQGYSY